MKGFLRFATRHPYLFTLLVFPVIPLGLMALQMGAAQLFGFTNVGPGTLQDSTKVLAVLLYLFILWRFGWLRPAGLMTPGRWQAWLVMVVASVLELGLVIGAINGHFQWRDLIVMADPPTYLLVGLFEEIAFRGLILYTYLVLCGEKRGGLWKSVLISALVFGLGHLLTIVNGNTLSGALYQAGSCAISGVLWAGLVLYGGSIWPAVMGHFLVDAIGQGNLVVIPDVTWANRVIFWWEMPLLLLGIVLVLWVSQREGTIRREPRPGDFPADEEIAVS